MDTDGDASAVDTRDAHTEKERTMSDYMYRELIRDRRRTLDETATSCHNARAARAARRLARQRANPPSGRVPDYDDAA